MAHHKELVGELIQFLNQLQCVENADGATSLILKYGRDFRALVNTPPWLQIGEPHQCFSNAAAQAIAREDVFYAEGYALEPELPIPIQHAWLVNSEGWVIDPTWKTTKGHMYFGMVFSRRFVTKMLGQTRGEAGILVNLHILRRQFRLFEHLEEEIETGLIRFGGSLNQRPAAPSKSPPIEDMSRLSMRSPNARRTEEGFR